MATPLRQALIHDALAARFAEIRAQTLALAAPLSPEDCVAQSMPDASPVKWHLAHTTWFFETFILEPRNVPAFDPAFRVLFNSYYNAVGEKHPRPERGLITRPPLDQVLAYRAHVEREMERVWPDARKDTALAALIELGVNHEQQHQELILTDLKHLLSRNLMRPAYRSQTTPDAPSTTTGVALSPAAAAPDDRDFTHFAEGLCEIGHEGRAFAFDNECPRHKVWVNAFEFAMRPVTNAEFLAFIGDGGYRRPELWLSLGWDILQAQHWHAPLYWEQRDGAWWRFTLAGMAAVDPAAPVSHVSYFEADAYARWAGARLPTEFEWEMAAHDAPVAGQFMDEGRFDPRPAPLSPTPHPVQLFGDVWEWTSSSYGPYPGFRIAPGAVGEYNGKFMCNQYVLRGGSCATPASHIRATYRNFFPPEARWQFSGIRLARDA
jgi:ergothioneine biosynthesis protein EgtB